jgi:hypothetical protein
VISAPRSKFAPGALLRPLVGVVTLFDSDGNRNDANAPAIDIAAQSATLNISFGVRGTTVVMHQPRASEKTLSMTSPRQCGKVASISCTRRALTKSPLSLPVLRNPRMQSRYHVAAVALIAQGVQLETDEVSY